jgi:hypothetical protein
MGGYCIYGDHADITVVTHHKVRVDCDFTTAQHICRSVTFGLQSVRCSDVPQIAVVHRPIMRVLTPTPWGNILHSMGGFFQEKYAQPAGRNSPYRDSSISTPHGIACFRPYR